MPCEKVEHLLRSICRIFEIIVIDEDLIIHALHLHYQNKISFYDCLMISAALHANCKYLISEDMSDGLLINNTLKIVNIFSHTDLLL